MMPCDNILARTVGHPAQHVQLPLLSVRSTYEVLAITYIDCLTMVPDLLGRLAVALCPRPWVNLSADVLAFPVKVQFDYPPQDISLRANEIAELGIRLSI